MSSNKMRPMLAPPLFFACPYHAICENALSDIWKNQMKRGRAKMNCRLPIEFEFSDEASRLENRRTSSFPSAVHCAPETMLLQQCPHLLPRADMIYVEKCDANFDDESRYRRRLVRDLLCAYTRKRQETKKALLRDRFHETHLDFKRTQFHLLLSFTHSGLFLMEAGIWEN